MGTRFPKLFATLTGLALPWPDPFDDLVASLTEQANRRGRGSDLAAAQLKGIRAAQMAAEPAVRNRAIGWRG